MTEAEENLNRVWRGIVSLMIVLGVFTIFLLFICTSGCVTASKDLYREITAPPPTPPTPTPTPEPTIEPTPTPEPAPEIMGLRPGQFLSFRRDNVSGYKDIKVHMTIYGYREYKEISWWSMSWGRIFKQSAPDGYKYLFVFAHVYSDEDSAKTWGIQPYNFFAFDGQAMRNRTEDLLPQIRLTEFDDVWDMRHVENIKPYGYLRKHINGGKEYAEEIGYLQPGESNAWDGYIPFIVPVNTRPEDIRIYTNNGNIRYETYWSIT